MKKCFLICLLAIAGSIANAQTGALTITNSTGCIAYLTMYCKAPFWGNTSNCAIQCNQYTLGPSSTVSWSSATSALTAMGILNSMAPVTVVQAGSDPRFVWCYTQVQYDCTPISAPSYSGGEKDPVFGIGGLCILPYPTSPIWSNPTPGAFRSNITVTY